jgi:uncharacterized protein (TIGR03435 family)
MRLLNRLVVLSLTILLCALTFVSSSTHRLQSDASQTPAPQSEVPDWETAAGGSMTFEVASVKQNKSGTPPSGDRPRSNVSLDVGPAFRPNGGLFSATNLTVYACMIFAYKITGSEFLLLRPQLPKWVNTERFDIQARASGTPTKDQMRLMMQALLADRFKLLIHREARQVPVFAFVTIKQEKTGPRLQPHPDDTSCSDAPQPPATPATSSAMFPAVCGAVVGMTPTLPGLARFGGRNLPIAEIVETLVGYANLERPAVNATNLGGTFDFTIEWMPQSSGPPASDGADQSVDARPVFLDALRDQLGLKLEPRTGTINVFKLDHIEEPSLN